MIESFFWLLVLIIIYVYFGYLLLLLILSKLRPSSPVQKADIIPTVSLIIAAYNEEQIIDRKIENCLALDYPREKLEIIVASDGSTDRTNKLVEKFEKKGVKLIALQENQGKSSVQNKAVAGAGGDILLFTDADVMLRKNLVKNLMKNLADKRVGCVIGKITYANEKSTSVTEGEGFYWCYELLLRRKESEVDNFAIGSGIMALRRTLFEPLEPAVGEDFVLPMKTVMAGFKVVYDSEAVTDTIMHQARAVDMLKTKVRVISKDLRGLFHCRAIMNPFRYPIYAWGLISHKLLRWLVPYFLIILFGSNLLLLDHPFYRLVLALQIAFYALAIAGYLWQRKGKPPRVLGILFSFCLVNLAALVGVARFIMGKTVERWVPVR